jgi:hypothetical protein
MDIYADMITGMKGNIRQMHMPADPFERIVRFVLVANWIAYEAAKIRNIDPFDVSLIERFKERMAGG